MMSVYSYRLYCAVWYGLGFDLSLAQMILSFVLRFAIQFQQSRHRRASKRVIRPCLNRVYIDYRCFRSVLTTIAIVVFWQGEGNRSPDKTS